MASVCVSSATFHSLRWLTAFDSRGLSSARAAAALIRLLLERRSASSLKSTHRCINLLCFNRKGAMPSPVELPTPKKRFMSLSSGAAVSGAWDFAI